MKQYRVSLVLVAALVLSMSACGKKSDDRAEAKAAVKVNGQVIGAAEIEPKAGNMDGPHKGSVSGERLKKIVDMELLRQAAVDSRLDADEKISARIASANRMILSTAYLEKALAAIGKPTEAEISAFYSQNPARFAERKQYEFNEFSIQVSPEKAVETQAQLGKLKKPQDFEQWLNANNIAHSSTPVSVMSDQLPEDVLQKILTVPIGGNTVLSSKGQMNVIFVLAAQLQPIALAQAQSDAARMLMEKRKHDMLENTLKQLRDKAKIEFVPPYTENGLVQAEKN